MDSRQVSRGLKTHIRPLLSSLGFRAFTTRSAWRYGDHGVDVVTFPSFNSYSAGVLRVTTFSFSVSLGRFFLDVPPVGGPLKFKGNEARPDEALCPFRCRLHRDLVQRACTDRGIWSVDEDGANLDEVLADVAAVIARELPYLFGQLDGHAAALEILEEQEERMESGWWGFGNHGSPVRLLLIGYFALRVGRFRQAHRSLLAAYESGCFDDDLRTRLEADMRWAHDQAEAKESV